MEVPTERSLSFMVINIIMPAALPNHAEIRLPEPCLKPYRRMRHPMASVFHIYGITIIIAQMKPDSVRTTVDIPAPLYRKLKEQAAAKGSSVRELVLAGIKIVVLKSERRSGKRLELPLIPASADPKVNLTNEMIYEHIEFP